MHTRTQCTGLTMTCSELTRFISLFEFLNKNYYIYYFILAFILSCTGTNAAGGGGLRIQPLSPEISEKMLYENNLPTHIIVISSFPTRLANKIYESRIYYIMSNKACYLVNIPNLIVFTDVLHFIYFQPIPLRVIFSCVRSWPRMWAERSVFSRDNMCTFFFLRGEGIYWTL
jgi:hypothetical protein